MKEFTNYAKKCQYLIVEQNAKKSIAISDHTYLLEDGKVVLHGGKDILKNPKIKEVYLDRKFLPNSCAVVHNSVVIVDSS